MYFPKAFDEFSHSAMASLYTFGDYVFGPE